MLNQRRVFSSLHKMFMVLPILRQQLEILWWSFHLRRSPLQVSNSNWVWMDSGGCLRSWLACSGKSNSMSSFYCGTILSFLSAVHANYRRSMAKCKLVRGVNDFEKIYEKYGMRDAWYEIINMKYSLKSTIVILVSLFKMILN